MHAEMWSKLDLSSIRKAMFCMTFHTPYMYQSDHVSKVTNTISMTQDDRVAQQKDNTVVLLMTQDYINE